MFAKHPINKPLAIGCATITHTHSDPVTLFGSFLGIGNRCAKLPSFLENLPSSWKLAQTRHWCANSRTSSISSLRTEPNRRRSNVRKIAISPWEPARVVCLSVVARQRNCAACAQVARHFLGREARFLFVSSVVSRCCCCCRCCCRCCEWLLWVVVAGVVSRY